MGSLTERKSVLTRVAWSLRTGPRADLVPDHVAVGLSHRPNFLPRASASPDKLYCTHFRPH